MSDYSDRILATPNLLAYWQMNEASHGDLADATGRGHTAVADAGAGLTYGVAGARATLGVAIQATGGITGRWAAADHADWDLMADEGSVECWLKQDGAGYGAIVGRTHSGTDANNHFALWIDTGSNSAKYLTRTVNPATFASVGWPAAGDSSWHHYVFVWDGTSLRRYVDGVLSGTTAKPGAGYRTVAGPVNIFGAASTFNPTCTAQHIALYSRALTATEITDHYNESPLPGVWIDWDDDGFDTDTTGDAAAPLARMMPELAGTSISDNIAARVKSFTWNRGGSHDHIGSDGPGSCTILLNNFDGRFDPDNTASPVYGKMVPGLPVWIGAIKTSGALSGTGTVRGVFGGYVREFNPTVRGGERVCEVICEDAFGRWTRTPVTVAPSLTRSHGDLRTAILDAIGLGAANRSLEAESGHMPISAVDSESALAVLEELNQATGSRHFIAPADTKEGWFTYTVVNREHKLAAAADETINADDVTDVSGWRVTNDNLVEQQRASVSPVTITSNNDPVWVYDGVPFSLSYRRAKTIWAEFDDYVFDASLDYNVSSGSVATTFTNFGKTAKIEIWTTTFPEPSITLLRILGRAVVRGDTEQVIAGSTDAGVRAGSMISSDYIGTPAMAQGVCDFIIYKFGQPLKRPSLTIVGKSTTTLATIFERDIYDVVNLVVDKLSVTSRRLELIGLSGSCTTGVGAGKNVWSTTYELQETPNSAAVSYFKVGTDTAGSSVPVAPW